jgi:hypothetical protein
VISPAGISSAGSGSVLPAPEKGGANSFVYAVFKVLYVNAKVELLLTIGSNINDWKMQSQDIASRSIVFKQAGGGLFSFKSGFSIKTSVQLTPLAGEQTQISFIAEYSALTDAMGYLDSALKKLIEPFQIQVAALMAINEGILCPKCGREMAEGTKFCPYDGTPILLECSQCNTPNTPSAKFCSSCGNSL